MRISHLTEGGQFEHPGFRDECRDCNPRCGDISKDGESCILGAGHTNGWHVSSGGMKAKEWRDENKPEGRCPSHHVTFDGFRQCDHAKGHPGQHEAWKSGDFTVWTDHLVIPDPADKPRYTHDGEPPAHYVGKDGMQPWDVIHAFGLDYWRGSVLKYLLRAGRKGSAVQDLKKARDFINKAIELEED